MNKISIKCLQNRVGVLYTFASVSAKKGMEFLYICVEIEKKLFQAPLNWTLMLWRSSSYFQTFSCHYILLLFFGKANNYNNDDTDDDNNNWSTVLENSIVRARILRIIGRVDKCQSFTHQTPALHNQVDVVTCCQIIPVSKNRNGSIRAILRQ